jgi:hypothetical protein
MSALCQKRTYAVQQILPDPEGDICSRSIDSTGGRGIRENVSVQFSGAKRAFELVLGPLDCLVELFATLCELSTITVLIA